ncbi:translation initiation factor IF-2 [Buchnera aphidicola]|uniref:Translation initiation factor IF-2 n=1 Tax=Buchnera aphidicola (Sarucallis kahawaluokalani) TaxID=1241878 RepID=A0A4D6YJ82_9GAMM|nr:translation initiation factor IF-2 [Buchnera aphidicola]QCI26044.1 translation initiation factor IF-2 [Buchnera aphidicola (Sarucallis kahawaluokalani)]
MSSITVQSLSCEMNITISELIKKFAYLGVIKKKNDYVSLQEKKLLLHYLSSRNELSLSMIQKKKISNVINRAMKTIKDQSKKNKLQQKDFHQDNVNQSGYQVISDGSNRLLHSKYDKSSKNNVLNNKNMFVKLDNKNIKNKTIINTKKNITIMPKKNKINLSNQLTIQKFSSLNNIQKNSNLRVLDDANKSIKYNNFRYKKNNIKNKNQKKFLKNKKFTFLNQNFIKPKQSITKNIVINKQISISELSNKMAIKSAELVKKIVEMGYTVTIDQIIDQETAQIIIEEMGHKAILIKDNSLEESILQEHQVIHKNYVKKSRPPVVTIMGHVDHGKTSLLDYIRSTRVVNNEFGGITQHIGAYYVTTKYGTITFLDTPGHAAFTSMRARGAQITDIVVLVVAGDDGVKPQTIEAIQHAKLAKVPILVAINKIDKKEVNIEKIKKELAEHDILPEEWGGENIFVNISCVTGEGIDNLLNAILLQSEILELSAVSSGLASGVVVEARLDKHCGPMLTILIRSGQLKKGDIILCGLHYGKVRTMKDSSGNKVKSSGPSIPIEISGLSGIPMSGDVFYVVSSEKKAREIALYRKNKYRDNKLLDPKELNINNMFNQLNKNNISILHIILKTDVKGSLEAISNAIFYLSNEKVNIKIVSSNVGNITETDVSLAVATHAIIIGFNVHTNVLAKRLLKTERVEVYYYSVIYHLIDAIKLMVSNMMTPQYKTLIKGSAEIRDIFNPGKSIFVAGCMVTSGIIKRKYSIHILRNSQIIYKGELDSLRRFKEDVQEVSSGKECGIAIKNYNNISIGDVIQSFKVIKIKHVH